MSILTDLQSLLPQQYKDAENMNKIIGFFAEELEEIQTVNDGIKNLLSIDDNSGYQLDVIGILVKEERLGRLDPEYREALQFKIFKNTSKGFVEDLILILKTITNATKIVYSDNPPASYTIYTDGSSIPDNLGNDMDNLSGGGIGVIVYASFGETPLIMDTVGQNEALLIDNNGNNIATNTGLQIRVVYNSDDFDKTNSQIYSGIGLGYIESDNLVDNLGNNFVLSSGENLVVVSADNDILESGKMNIVV